MSTSSRPEPPDPSRPFTRTQALAGGLTVRQLNGRSYQRLHTGIYLGAGVPVTPLLAARAALLPFGPAARASHATAARVWGLPLPVMPDEHVTVEDRKARRSRPGIRCHSGPDRGVAIANGVRISDRLQTFVELGELLPLVDLVVVGDHLIRTTPTGLDELRRHCAGSRHTGARNAATAAGHVRAAVDSPMESRVRMLLVLAGLPEPTVNVTLRDEYGEPIRRYDLYYPHSCTAVEYDGRQHIERIEQWEADLARRQAIDDDGDRIIVLTAKSIYTWPARTLETIHRVLLTRGEPAVPKRLDDRWRRHFADRR